MAADPPSIVTVQAFAKINTTLRVLGVRKDGYHSLRTTFQSVLLHDTLTFRQARGALHIDCNNPACPTDRTNLVWRAAEQVWRAAGRSGAPANVHARMLKRIPLQSGLGGGSSDAAAAIRGLAVLWRVNLSDEQRRAIASRLGADVPYFLDGGTALGVDRGDVVFPLRDQSPAWVVLAIPPVGVSTSEAYGWWDARHPRDGRGGRASRAARDPGNDLQAAVVSHHPAIGRLARALQRLGAREAAMSGSGSAVFGLFDSRHVAEAAADALSSRSCQTIVTRTLSRARYQAMSRPTSRSEPGPKGRRPRRR